MRGKNGRYGHQKVNRQKDGPDNSHTAAVRNAAIIKRFPHFPGKNLDKRCTAQRNRKHGERKGHHQSRIQPEPYVCTKQVQPPHDKWSHDYAQDCTHAWTAHCVT